MTQASSGAEGASCLPKVSVLMTVYNGAAVLQEAVDSLLAQSLDDFELIIVDDGSTDQTPAIIAALDDPRIVKLHPGRNIGRTPALNLALEAARAPYVAVLDADDIDHPDRLRCEAELLDQNPDVLLVGSWSHVVSLKDNKPLYDFTPATENLRQQLGFDNPISHSSSMYRRKEALAVGGYPLQFRYAQDYALWVRLAAIGEVMVIPAYLLTLRHHDANMSFTAAYSAARAYDGWAITCLALEMIPLSPENRKIALATKAKLQTLYALSLMRERRYGKGFWLGVTAFLSHPVSLSRLFWKKLRPKIGNILRFLHLLPPLQDI